MHHGPLQGQELPGRDGFHIPGPWSLAYRLIHGWLPGGSGHEWAGDQMPDVAIDEGASQRVPAVVAMVWPRTLSDPRSNLVPLWPCAPRHVQFFAAGHAQALNPAASMDKNDVIAHPGVFKYVLLRLRDPEAIGDPRARKLLVWGDRRAAYHMDIFSQAKAKVGSGNAARRLLGVVNGHL